MSRMILLKQGPPLPSQAMVNCDAARDRAHLALDLGAAGHRHPAGSEHSEGLRASGGVPPRYGGRTISSDHCHFSSLLLRSDFRFEHGQAPQKPATIRCGLLSSNRSRPSEVVHVLSYRPLRMSPVWRPPRAVIERGRKAGRVLRAPSSGQAGDLLRLILLCRLGLPRHSDVDLPAGEGLELRERRAAHRYHGICRRWSERS